MDKLSKNDPVYYKVEINKLIDQARKNGLEIDYGICGKHYGTDVIKIHFTADNGDVASATVYNCEWNKDGD